MLKQMTVTMSFGLKFIFPLVFVLGAIYSLTQSREKKRIYEQIEQSPNTSSLNNLNWQQFELLIGKYFEKKGYAVRQVALPGADGGVDL
jgi:hypothetical protein